MSDDIKGNSGVLDTNRGPVENPSEVSSDQRLGEVEALLHRQYQSFPIPTYTWQHVDDDFLLIDFNEAVLKLLHTTINDFKFVRASNFLQEKPEIYANIQKCFFEKITIQEETHYSYTLIKTQRWLKFTYVYADPDLVFVHTEDIDEQKQAMQALKEQEQRLKLITDNMLDMILATDDQSLITYASPSHQRILGYHPEDLVGKPAALFCHPDDLGIVIQNFQKAAQSKEILEIEFRVRHSDGHYIRMETFGTPIYREDGQPAGLIFSSRDISRRKAAEEQLSASEAKFRQLAENIREVFWLSDPIKHEMIYTSPAYIDLWGVSREDLYQQHSSFLDVVHPEDRPAVERITHEELAHPISFEYRVIHPDGTTRWLRDRAFPMKDDRGTTYRIAGITEDITDLKRTELALREQTDFENLILRLSLALIDTEPYQLTSAIKGALGEVGMHIRAEHGFIFSYNPITQQFEKMIEWSKAPASMLSMEDFVSFKHGFNHQPGDEADQQKMMRGLHFHPDIRVAPDIVGREKLQQYGMKSLLHIPIVSSNGFVGMLGFVTYENYADWSGAVLSMINLFGSIVANTIARRTAEISLLKSNQALEDKVRERTAELSYKNTQLQAEIEQRKQVEAKLREENDFINALFDTAGVLIFALDHQDRIVVSNHQCEVLTGLSSAELNGCNIFDLKFLSVDEVIDTRNRYEVYKKGDPADKWYSENRPILQDGSEHIIAWSATRVQEIHDAKYFAVFLGVDITEHRHLQKKLRWSEDRYHRLFLDLPISILEVELKGNAEGAVIFNANLRARETYGQQIMTSRNFPLADLFAQDSQADEARVIYQAMTGKKKDIESTHIHANGDLFPVRISVGQDPDPDSTRFVLVIEDLTAEKARRSEEIAITEERQRIAREIHDGIAQDLASLRMRTNYWKSILKSAPDKLPAEFDFLQQQLGDNIQEVRRSIFALRPIALEKGSFFSALAKYIQEFGIMNGLVTHLSLPDQLPALGSDLELATFRIIQEGLNNIAKHADAENVWVSLEIPGSALLALSIQDDGIGFNPADIFSGQHSEHIGLQQMKARVQRMHGILNLTSMPNEGTTIKVQIPFEAE